MDTWQYNRNPFWLKINMYCYKWSWLTVANCSLLEHPLHNNRSWFHRFTINYKYQTQPTHCCVHSLPVRPEWPLLASCHHVSSRNVETSVRCLAQGQPVNVDMMKEAVTKLRSVVICQWPCNTLSGKRTSVLYSWSLIVIYLQDNFFASSACSRTE